MTPHIFLDATYERVSGDGPAERYMAYTAPVSAPASGEWRPASHARPAVFSWSINALLRTAEHAYEKDSSVYATPVRRLAVFDPAAEPQELPLEIGRTGKVMLVLPLGERETLFVGALGVSVIRDGEVAWLCRRAISDPYPSGWFYPQVAAVKDRVAYLGYANFVNEEGTARIFSISLDDPPANWPHMSEWLAAPGAAGHPLDIAIAMAGMVQNIDYGVVSDVQNTPDGVMGPENTWMLANLYLSDGKAVAMVYDTAVSEGQLYSVLKAEAGVLAPDGITARASSTQVLTAINIEAPPGAWGDYVLRSFGAHPSLVWATAAAYQWFWTDLLQAAEEPALLVPEAPAPIPLPGNPDPGGFEGAFELAAIESAEGIGYMREVGGGLTPDVIELGGKALSIDAVVWNPADSTLRLRASAADLSAFPVAAATLIIRTASAEFRLDRMAGGTFEEHQAGFMLGGVTSSPWSAGISRIDLALVERVDFILQSRDTGENDMGFYEDFGGAVIPNTFSFQGLEIEITALVWNGVRKDVAIGLRRTGGAMPVDLTAISVVLTGSGTRFDFQLVDGWGTILDQSTDPWPIGSDYGFNLILPKEPEPEPLPGPGPLSNKVVLTPGDLSALQSGAVGYRNNNVGGTLEPSRIKTLFGEFSVYMLARGMVRSDLEALSVGIVREQGAGMPATLRVTERSAEAYTEVSMTSGTGTGRWGDAYFPASPFKIGVPLELEIEDVTSGRQAVAVDVQVTASYSSYTKVMGYSSASSGGSAGGINTTHFQSPDGSEFEIQKIGKRTDIGAPYAVINRVAGAGVPVHAWLRRKDTGEEFFFPSPIQSGSQYTLWVNGMTGEDLAEGGMYEYELLVVVQ